MSLACNTLSEQRILACQAQRKRLVAALLLLDMERGRHRTSGGPKAPVPDFSWDEHVQRFSEAQFKLRYRLSFHSFNKLLAILAPSLAVTNEKQACNSRSDKPVELPTRLAVALRYFAGGDPLDLMLIYGMSKTMVMRCVWRVVDAIHKHLDNMHFPIDDVEKLKVLEADFSAASRGGFWRGQVGAIDGVHFRMECPTERDVPDAQRYHVDRKNSYCLLAMAICDSKRRFTWADIGMAPSTHDSTAWSATPLGIRVEGGDLPYPFFLNGDSAFTVSPSMITPSNNDPALDDFDFYQSSNRMAIECAFGILIRRWGVLWRKLRQRFNRRAPLIGALMRLHNFCIDERLIDEDDLPDVHAQFTEVQPDRYCRPPLFDKDGRPVDYLQTTHKDAEGAPQRDRAQGKGERFARRDELVRAVRESGFKRIIDPNLHRTKKRPRGRQAE